MVKMAEEKLKMDVREDIRAAGITTMEFLTWDRGQLKMVEWELRRESEQLSSQLWSSLPGIEAHGEDGGGGVEDECKGGHQGCWHHSY
jgi:hypothetical protein